MKVIIGVTNFGKIKKAEINISNFTVFVGNNNSGKTMMMQLIYGVLDSLSKYKTSMKLSKINIGEEFIIKEEIKELEKRINYFLRRNKEQIILDTFHKSIDIEQLYVKLDMENEFFEIKLSERTELVERHSNKGTLIVDEKYVNKFIDISLKHEVSKEIISKMQLSFLGEPSLEYLGRIIYSYIVKIMFDTKKYRTNDAIFIPASRTGMLLLYKYFFAEKTTNDIDMDIRHSADEEKGDNELGLSRPVYDFLLFLLRYTPGHINAKNNKKLIEFIQQNLMEGELIQMGDETFYVPNGSDKQIPLYLASSMINEVTPLLKVLTGARQYSRIFYDEIETCLHPLKQGEMVRTLFRMSNKGYRLIVSTHSDTMANKINNLLLLSKIEEPKDVKRKKLKKMKLSDDDILITDDFHVYQFVNQPDGTSEVSELIFRKTPPTGYDFSLFMESVNELYEETSTVME